MGPVHEGEGAEQRVEPFLRYEPTDGRDRRGAGPGGDRRGGDLAQRIPDHVDSGWRDVCLRPRAHTLRLHDECRGPAIRDASQGRPGCADIVPSRIDTLRDHDGNVETARSQQGAHVGAVREAYDDVGGSVAQRAPQRAQANGIGPNGRE